MGKLRAYLNKHFTDRVDYSLDISLFEYGIIRNPETGKTVLCSNYGESKPDYCVDFATIETADVIEAIKEMPDGFFSYIDSSREQELEQAEKWPKDHANIINSMNSYNGWFKDTTYYPSSNIFCLRRLIPKEPTT